MMMGQRATEGAAHRDAPATVLPVLLPPGEVIALARARRSVELGRLPGWGRLLTLQQWRHIREHLGDLSSGTLVAVLRRAVRQRQGEAVQDVFLLLLQRIEAANRFWARQSAARWVGSMSETADMVADDLCQELTLWLWEELAHREAEGWELFFRRSLAFARRRVAARYRERYGYRLGERVVRFFSEIAPESAEPAHPVDDPPPMDLADRRDPFMAADLADLRGYVGRLPPRERIAVVLRYWQRAREHEIAAALGVTPRTVRNLLRRAHQRLHALYTGAAFSTEGE